MTISEKLKAISMAVDTAAIKAARMFDEAQILYNDTLLTERSLPKITTEVNNLFAKAVTTAQKGASPLSNEIGTNLPKNIKNVWSNFKRERGIQSADSDYAFHFCDTLPNGHDLTDDELGWPNGIPIAFDGGNDLAMVMPDFSYCETGMNIDDFPFMENTDRCNYLVNPTRYIIYYNNGGSQYLYISERLYEWKCLDISALKVMDNQICCDHNGIIYALCTGDLIRVLDPDKYTYTRSGNSSDLMVRHTVTIAEVSTQDVNQLQENTQNVSIVVGGNTIIRSIDDGLSWTKIAISGVNGDLNCIHYANNTWIIASSNEIFRSVDNGLTWNYVVSMPHTQNSCYYSNGVWIITGWGVILRSTDNGLTWTQIAIMGINNQLRSPIYANDTWIIVGYEGTILRSTDNGLGWIKIKVSGVTDSLASVRYANNTWIAIGGNDTIIRSTDNGLTWTKITVSGLDYYLFDIHYANNTWIIVGSYGTIVRSTDNGLTWTNINCNLYNEFMSIRYVNNTWIIVGSECTIIRSTDDGLTWTKVTVSGISSDLYLSNIGINANPQFHRYGGEQFRKNYNFAEYFVSTNNDKLLIGGNVLGTSMTEEAGFVGKIEPGTVHKNWDGSDIQAVPDATTDVGIMFGDINIGHSVYTDRDAIAIGGRYPYFVINNPMDIGMLGLGVQSGYIPTHVLGIRYMNGYLVYCFIESNLMSYHKFVVYPNYIEYYSDHDQFAPPDSVLDASYPSSYLPLFPNRSIMRETPYGKISIPVPYVTRSDGSMNGYTRGHSKRLVISQDTIEVSPGRYLMLEIDSAAVSNKIGLYITDEIFPVAYENGYYIASKDNISSRSIRIDNLASSYFSEYIKLSSDLERPYQSGVHMVRGGDYVYIWMTASDNTFLAWVYNLKTGRVINDWAYINSYTRLKGKVLSISASNTMQTIKRGDSLPPIISNVFITVLDGGVVKYYYLNYKATMKSAYEYRAFFTEFDPTNKYNATQTIVGNNNRRQTVRFNDKSIYYNHGNVFVRLDYLDPSTTSDEYLGNIKHKYLMCGLNNTAMNLRAIEDTDTRTGSFICSSVKTEVKFTKLNMLNKRTSIQNSRDQMEEFTPDIIVIYNLGYDDYDPDTDDLSYSQYATYLSDTQFIAIFKKDEYVIDDDRNVSSGNLLVKTGGTNGTRYSMVQGNGGPIDLIVYPNHMEVNLSSEFLGTKLSYLAIGQRGCAID